MKLIDKLGIDLITSGLIGVGSKCGLGKTTLLILLSSELIMDGKKVLYLTNELSEFSIISKYSKVLKSTVDSSNVRVKKFVSLHDVLEIQLNETDFDFVVIDGILNSNDIEYCNYVAKEYDCVIVTTHQLSNKGTDKYLPTLAPKNNRILILSNIFLIINNKNIFSIFDKIKYFLLFWLKKPNRTILVIKNRYGDESITNIYIDFEKISVN